jgi:hypothetical protein
MESTEIRPLFFNQEKLIKLPKVIYRTTVGNNRYYYCFNDDGSMVKDPSVTTILDSEMRQPEWLIKWISEWGFRRAIEKRDQSAAYGSLFSLLAASFLRDRRFDLETIKPRIDVFVQQERIDFSVDHWDYKLREDLYALHQFILDYEVEPLAVEIVLSSQQGFAGAIDAVVEMNVGTGVNGKILKSDKKYDKSGLLLEDKTRRITAIIDWKSGRHGFSRNNEAQLHMYKILWEENFPHLPVDALYNWAPKEWNGNGELYSIKEQSQSIERLKIMNYVENFRLEHNNDNDRVYKHINGVLEFDKSSNNIRFETFEERAKRIHNIKKTDIPVEPRTNGEAPKPQNKPRTQIHLTEAIEERFESIKELINK